MKYHYALFRKEIEEQEKPDLTLYLPEEKYNRNHSTTTGQFIGADDGAGGVHADVLTTMPAHIAKALSDKGAMTRGADGVYTANINGKTYRIVPTGSTRIAFSQTGASRIADLVGASDTVPVVHSGTVDKEPVVVSEDVKSTPLDDKTATEAMEKMPPDQVTKVGMLEYILGMKQDQSGHYTLNQKTGKINLTQLSSALVKKDIAIQSHSFLMKVIGKSFLRNSIDHGILGKFLTKETKALILSKEYAANDEAALGFAKRFEILHQLAGMKNPTWEDFFKITAHPESQTGGMPPKHPAVPTSVKPLKKPAAHGAPAAKPHAAPHGKPAHGVIPVPRKKPGHRSHGKMHEPLDLSLYLPEEKQNDEEIDDDTPEHKDQITDAENQAINTIPDTLAPDLVPLVEKFLAGPVAASWTLAERQDFFNRLMGVQSLEDLSARDQELLTGEAKYNPAHGHNGQFTTTENAHLLVHRDGTTEKGPAHPDNQKKDILEQVRPPDAVLKKYDIQGAAFAEKHAQTHNMTAEEYNKAVDDKAVELLKNAEPWMRVRPTILSKILDDERFKSQFETNTSAGIMDHDSRSEAEHDLFGYPDDLAKEQRPLYGYLSDHPDGASLRQTRHGMFDSVDEYGGVAVRFKPEVKQKTTWTGDDSLGMGGYLLPGSMLHPDHTNFSVHGPDPLTYQNVSDVRGYPEAQFHGGLNTSTIAEIVFHNDYELTPPLEAQLKAKGISYRVSGTKSVEQFEEKYNPAHDHVGKFTTTENAHLLVHADGTREKGPKHPDNQEFQKTEAKYSNPEDIPYVKNYMDTGKGPIPGSSSATDADACLQEIYKAQGFDGPPHVVEDNVLAQHIKDGEAELYRGVDDGGDPSDGLGYAASYQSGHYFAGLGVYGNGTYTALTTEGVSDRYSASHVAATYGDDVLHMSVLKNTTAIEKGRLINEWIDYKNDLRTRGKALDDAGKYTESRRIDRLFDLANDPGRYAAMKGYDAIYVDRSHVDSINKRADFLVVLNRTATRVGKTILNGDTL